VAAEWWQLAEGWELYDWSLFVDIPAPVEGKDLGGSAPRGRRPRTAVYGTAKAELVFAPLVSSAIARPPTVVLAPVRVSAVVAGSASATLTAHLTTRQAFGSRRTFATANTSRLVAPSLSAAAVGSVWTQVDEEAELMMLGLFA
jgi:hypothetical protein